MSTLVKRFLQKLNESYALVLQYYQDDENTVDESTSTLSKKFLSEAKAKVNPKMQLPVAPLEEPEAEPKISVTKKNILNLRKKMGDTLDSQADQLIQMGGNTKTGHAFDVEPSAWSTNISDSGTETLNQRDAAFYADMFGPESEEATTTINRKGMCPGMTTEPGGCGGEKGKCYGCTGSFMRVPYIRDLVRQRTDLVNKILDTKGRSANRKYLEKLAKKYSLPITSIAELKKYLETKKGR